MIRSTPSGLQTASAQIYAGPCCLTGVDVTPPDTTGITVVIVYDSENSTTSGKTVLSELIVDAGFTSINHEFFVPVIANRGIYCTYTSTGTGSKYNVRYSAG